MLVVLTPRWRAIPAPERPISPLQRPAVSAFAQCHIACAYNPPHKNLMWIFRIRLICLFGSLNILFRSTQYTHGSMDDSQNVNLV